MIRLLDRFGMWICVLSFIVCCCAIAVPSHPIHHHRPAVVR